MKKLGYEPNIDDTFLDELVLAVSQNLIPLFADFANYLASVLVLKVLTSSSASDLCMR